MTDKEWEERLLSMEARAKLLLRVVVSFAGALAIAAVSLLGLWHQVVDTQEGVAVNTAKIVDQEVHLAVTDDRANKGGLPPPDPVVAVQARQAAEVDAAKTP